MVQGYGYNQNQPGFGFTGQATNPFASMLGLTGPTGQAAPGQNYYGGLGGPFATVPGGALTPPKAPGSPLSAMQPSSQGAQNVQGGLGGGFGAMQGSQPGQMGPAVAGATSTPSTGFSRPAASANQYEMRGSAPQPYQAPYGGQGILANGGPNMVNGYALAPGLNAGFGGMQSTGQFGQGAMGWRADIGQLDTGSGGDVLGGVRSSGRWDPGPNGGGTDSYGRVWNSQTGQWGPASGNIGIGYGQDGVGLDYGIGYGQGGFRLAGFGGGGFSGAGEGHYADVYNQRWAHMTPRQQKVLSRDWTPEEWDARVAWYQSQNRSGASTPSAGSGARV